MKKRNLKVKYLVTATDSYVKIFAEREDGKLFFKDGSEWLLIKEPPDLTDKEYNEYLEGDHREI